MRANWIRKHPSWAFLIVVPILPLAFGIHWWFWPSIPRGTVEDVEAIDVHLMRWENEADPDNRQEEVKLTCTDPARIRELLEVFRSAEWTSEHKCASSGTITIRKKNGAAEEVGILPGHDPAYYEYRYGRRINRVDRERFLAALKELGVKQIKLSPP